VLGLVHRVVIEAFEQREGPVELRHALTLERRPAGVSAT
jgi:hypothetical protein